MQNTSTLKLVDKYEFAQISIIRTADHVQIIPATHTLSRQQFTLKKINIKQNSSGKYQSLINQVAMLKEIGGDWAIKCHKMLKTSNNLYLVYDRISDHTLSAFLMSKPKGSQIKVVIGSILDLLEVLKAKGICMLTLNPNALQVYEKEGKLSVRIINMEYAANLDKGIDEMIINSMKKSLHDSDIWDYLAPETKQGKIDLIGIESDIYSLAKIIQSTKLQFLPQSPQDLSTLLSSMLTVVPLSRPSLSEVSQRFSKTSKTSTLPKAQFHGSTSVRLVKSNRKLSGVEGTGSSMHKAGKSQKSLDRSGSIGGGSVRSSGQNHEGYRIYTLKIMKKRNFAIFLLNLSKTCLSLQFASADITTITSFILLKKSTLVISQLAKFMHTGHNDPNISIPEKEVTRFFKTQDFLELQATINKQMNFQKKWLQQIADQIRKFNPDLIRNQNFVSQLTNQRINEQFLKASVTRYLKQTTRSPRLQRIPRDLLSHLALLSYLLDFNSYQKMFEELINEEIIQLENQTLYTQISRLEPARVIQKIIETIKNC